MRGSLISLGPRKRAQSPLPPGCPHKRFGWRHSGRDGAGGTGVILRHGPVGPVEQKLQPILFSMAPKKAAQEGRDHDE